MAAFAKSVFEAGQSVPCEIHMNPKSYLPKKTAISTSLDELLFVLQQNFCARLKDTFLPRCCNICRFRNVESARSTLYDFTLHHVDIVKGKTMLEVPKFNMKSTETLLIESPDVNNAANVRAHLTQCMSALYGIYFHSIQKTFLS